MQIFISLSNYWTRISNAIFEGNRSFKCPINPIMVEFRSFSTHPPPPSSCSPFNSQPTTHNSPETSPSPLLRDVGSNLNVTLHLQMRTLLHLPFRFPEECWPLKLAWWRNGGDNTSGGTQDHVVHQKNEPRWMLCFIFFISSFIRSNWLSLYPIPV